MITSITKPTNFETAKATMSFSGFSDAAWSCTDVALNKDRQLTWTIPIVSSGIMQFILESSNEFTVELNGTTTDDDLKFTVGFTIRAKVKASPL